MVKEKLANIKKSTVEKPNANAALKDGVKQDVDNHKARFACIIIFSIYIMAKTRRRRNVHRRKTKKHHRRRKTKRRVKRRRKTTRKKRGRGLGPSKMAKGAVAALAASAAMGQGMGQGISPSEGTAAVKKWMAESKCEDFHPVDIKPHHPDQGATNEHFREVYPKWRAKKSYCKKTKQPFRKLKPKKKAGGESGS